MNKKLGPKKRIIVSISLLKREYDLQVVISLQRLDANVVQVSCDGAHRYLNLLIILDMVIHCELMVLFVLFLGFS